MLILVAQKRVCLFTKAEKREEGGGNGKKGRQGSTVTTIVTMIIDPLSTTITIGIPAISHPHRLHQHQ